MLDRRMKVLVACETSGTVRDAFIERGHDAVSCDLLPTDVPGPHYQGDVFNIINDGWDMMIAHPPCTHLAVSGAAHFEKKEEQALQRLALWFVRDLMNAPIRFKCIENPVSVISSWIRKPDQIIQPWMFGHEEVKTTCLWLYDLPKLKPTCVVDERDKGWIRRLSPSEDRWEIRSKTFLGIACAMANQWG